MQTPETALEPRVETLPTQPYLALPLDVSMATLGEAIADAVQQVADEIARRGLDISGPPLFRYRRIAMPHSLSLEVGFPLKALVDAGDGFVCDVLPNGTYAVAEHRGPPTSLVAANGALQAWAQAKGLALDVTSGQAGDHWGCRFEQQLVGPDETDNLDAWVTRIAYRLAGFVWSGT